jgi:hypothetical protein
MHGAIIIAPPPQPNNTKSFLLKLNRRMSIAVDELWRECRLKSVVCHDRYI